MTEEKDNKQNGGKSGEESELDRKKRHINEVRENIGYPPIDNDKAATIEELKSFTDQELFDMSRKSHGLEPMPLEEYEELLRSNKGKLESTDPYYTDVILENPSDESKKSFSEKEIEKGKSPKGRDGR